MNFSFQNLPAALTFVLITMASLHSCAGWQHGVRVGSETLRDRVVPLRRLAGDRLGAERLSDLRAGRIEPRVDRFEEPKMPVVSGASLRWGSLSGLPDQTEAHRERTLFAQDQPPVMVVWGCSGLCADLLSTAELRQRIQLVSDYAVPAQAAGVRARRFNSEFGSGSQVRQASFLQPVIEGAATLSRSQQQVGDFKKDLATIRGRFEAKKKQVATDESVNDSNKSEMSNLLSLAGDWLERAATDLEKLASEIKREDGFEDELAEQERQLAKEKMKAGNAKLSTKAELLPSDLGEAIDVLQRKLKEQESLLQASNDERGEIREQISARDQRVTELPGLLRKTAKEEEDTKKMIAALNGPSDDLDRSLHKLLLDAKFLSLEITEKSLNLEGRRKEQVGRILPLRVEELTLKIKRVKAELAVLSVRSDELRDREIKERLRAAREALDEQLTQSTPMLKELAEFNKDLAGQQTSLAVKSDELENELINVRQLQEELDASHKRIKDQIETLGPTASGIRLVEHRRSLISTGKSQNRLLELAERMQSKQTRKLLLQERRDQLVLGDNFKLSVLAAVEQQVVEPVQRQTAVDVAGQLLETQKKYAMDLLDVFEDNIKKLSQLEAAHSALIDKVQEVKAFSDKNALWVRSAKPIKFSDLNLCQSGFCSFLVSDQWQGLGDHAYATFQKRPYDAGLLALVIGTLLVVRRRLRWSHE